MYPITSKEHRNSIQRECHDLYGKSPALSPARFWKALRAEIMSSWPSNFCKMLQTRINTKGYPQKWCTGWEYWELPQFIPRGISPSTGNLRKWAQELHPWFPSVSIATVDIGAPWTMHLPCQVDQWLRYVCTNNVGMLLHMFIYGDLHVVRIILQVLQ